MELKAEQKSKQTLPSGVNLIGYEVTNKAIDLSSYFHVSYCKFLNCDIKIDFDDGPLFNGTVFENCTFDLGGKRCSIESFDVDEPCILKNSQMELGGTEKSLKTFLGHRKPEFKHSFRADDIEILKYCFGSCTYNGNSIDQLCKEIENGVYGQYLGESYGNRVPLINKYIDDAHKDIKKIDRSK